MPYFQVASNWIARMGVGVKNVSETPTFLEFIGRLRRK